ncbi:Predicted hydrolase of the HAD superfamily [Prochlorococcus marinus str. MIT 9515]|uniref:Predicted hydrolase of the HAD superfamily n=1 Tax=Prochlorococcus marinus (strain MIT 9515) TaxID=167542 RepID=A2BW40_PROM5|nr:YqeG family HAD IIIA-type phosphatase [Prochlorococcus marinus]ABM72001.1 Predicted hydrolase of the HAD superfamily [Prochlorococcus marinus str. MIT 9515]
MNSFVKADWDSKLPIYEISHLKLQKEGIKSLLIDVDGTLLSRQSNVIPINVKNWIKESKKLFSMYLISNNPSDKRIRKIAKELDLRYKSNALKPRKKITLDVISEIKEDSRNIAIIGDRIFTDIIVGNRCNIQTILVKRLSREGLPIKINLTLILEKLISTFLK